MYQETGHYPPRANYPEQPGATNQEVQRTNQQTRQYGYPRYETFTTRTGLDQFGNTTWRYDIRYGRPFLDLIGYQYGKKIRGVDNFGREMDDFLPNPGQEVPFEEGIFYGDVFSSNVNVPVTQTFFELNQNGWLERRQQQVDMLQTVNYRAIRRIGWEDMPTPPPSGSIPYEQFSSQQGHESVDDGQTNSGEQSFAGTVGSTLGGFVRSAALETVGFAGSTALETARFAGSTALDVAEGFASGLFRSGGEEQNEDYSNEQTGQARILSKPPTPGGVGNVELNQVTGQWEHVEYGPNNGKITRGVFGARGEYYPSY
jgi:hypothetical protein